MTQKGHNQQILKSEKPQKKQLDFFNKYIARDKKKEDGKTMD